MKKSVLSILPIILLAIGRSVIKFSVYTFLVIWLKNKWRCCIERFLFDMGVCCFLLILKEEFPGLGGD